MRRASARLTSVDFTAFVLQELPPAPARVLEIGCGDAGGVVPALVDAGYDALGVDPRAPAGPRFQQVDFREIDGGSTPSSPAASSTTCTRSTRRSTSSPRSHRCSSSTSSRGTSSTRSCRPGTRRTTGSADSPGPPSLDEWRWRHPGLHPHDVLLDALRARYDERTLEWVPYFHRWLGDGVASPDRIGYSGPALSFIILRGASALAPYTSTTRSSAPSR